MGILKKVTASQQSIHKACSFAYKNTSMHESLFECILDELSQASINARLNLFFVLDAICQSARKQRFRGYLELVQANIQIIISLVSPDDSTGLFNLAHLQKVRYKYG